MLETSGLIIELLVNEHEEMFELLASHERLSGRRFSDCSANNLSIMHDRGRNSTILLRDSKSLESRINVKYLNEYLTRVTYNLFPNHHSTVPEATHTKPQVFENPDHPRK